MSKFLFLKTMIRDIATVGAVTPSSGFVVKKVIEALPRGVKTIVEYGPGDGVITRQLLKKLPPDGRLLAIELNEEFARKMKEIKDPRLVVVVGDAIDSPEIVRKNNIGPVDAVVSGIAFTFNYFFIPDKTKKAIVESAHRILRPKGAFILYQSSLLMMKFLKKDFSTAFVYEPRNFPPYFIIRAERKSVN